MAGKFGTESCGGCLKTQFRHLPPQLALKLSLVRLQGIWNHCMPVCTGFKRRKSICHVQILIHKLRSQ